MEEMLTSEEFINNYVWYLLDDFQHLKRELFVHIPKTGGTTVIHAFKNDPRFSVLKMPSFVKGGWMPDVLGLFGEATRSLLNSNTKYIALDGHPSIRDLITFHAKRADDSIFTVLRDPYTTAVSFINFVIDFGKHRN